MLTFLKSFPPGVFLQVLFLKTQAAGGEKNIFVKMFLETPLWGSKYNKTLWGFTCNKNSWKPSQESRP